MFDHVQQSWQALWAIPHIRAWLTVAWIGYLLWLGSWIVLQKREPVATISWLVSLAALPYIGFFIYYLFGPQRIRRHRLQRLRRRRQRAENYQQDSCQRSQDGRQMHF